MCVSVHMCVPVCVFVCVCVCVYVCVYVCMCVKHVLQGTCTCTDMCPLKTS